MQNRFLTLIPVIATMFIVVACGHTLKQKEPEVFKPSNPYKRAIDSLVSLMTLEEKVHMLHANGMFSSSGVARLGIPDLQYTDGPLGIREELQKHSWAPAGLTTDSATFFPAGGGLSATWNPALAKRYGIGIGEEARARNKDILLAPAINIIRSPLCGRNFEYLSEDPFLNKKLVVPYIRGVQEQDVAVCVKHYAVNNQETRRGSIDVQVDERTLREIYLPAYRAAVIEAGAYSVMGAYNRFRGDYLCENAYMLNTILKGEWGFRGIVVSDWGAVHSTVAAAQNGLDVEMGSEGPYEDWYFSNPLIKAVKDRRLPESLIDEKVKRILWVMYNLKMIGPDHEERKKGTLNGPRHRETAYEAAAESIVLLKNSRDLLPLAPGKIKSLAVIGENAIKKHAAGGFGAGVKAQREVTPLEGLTGRIGDQVKIRFAMGYRESYLDKTNKTYGRSIDYSPDRALLNEAVKVAGSSDAAVVFIGSNRIVESEAADRNTIRLPFGQEELVAAVQQANPNTIVVVIAGAPFDLTKVEARVSALIWGWFNGSEAGNAIADVLTGKVNPSGKLPFTLPKKLEDAPAHATNSFPGDTAKVVYKEGLLVGYRWFDAKGIDPHFAFGHGLSYSKFVYSNLLTDKPVYREDETITVSLRVKNAGPYQGKETVQLYIQHPDPSRAGPAKALKGFHKTALEAGQTGQIAITIPVKELAHYDTTSRQWKVQPGQYRLLAGASSRDIRQEVTFEITAGSRQNRHGQR